MAVAIAVELDEARLAAKLTMTGIPAGADTFTIERASPSGNTAGVRGAVNAPVTPPTAIARDYELPLDVPVTYTATVWDGDTEVGTAQATFEITYGECEAWLVDLARPTNSLPVVIESMTELGFEAAVGVHHVINRRDPVFTTAPAWTPSAELVVLTDTLTERDAVRVLLGSGYPVLLRTTPALGIGNMYLGVTGFVEERILTGGAAPQRRFRTACVQVVRPDPALYVPMVPNTYATVTATWATYQDLKDGAATYDEIAYTWPDEPELDPVVPWLPDDV